MTRPHRDYEGTDLAHTVEWALRITLAARKAQAFTRIRDFARDGQELREQRGKVRKRQRDPVPRAVLGTVERIMFERPASWLTTKQRARVAARAAAIRSQRYQQQRNAMAIDPDAPDTLGWRAWNCYGGVLVSPVMHTPWHDTTLKAEQWSDEQAVCGEAGIHARRMPKDWLRVDVRSFPEFGRCCNVHGIVERFGRYVPGTEGWRAEWVVIRELMAPDTETAMALMRRYPEVKVHIRERETV